MVLKGVVEESPVVSDLPLEITFPLCRTFHVGEKSSLKTDTASRLVKISLCEYQFSVSNFEMIIETSEKS